MILMESREDYFYPKVKKLLIGFLFFLFYFFLLSMVVEIFDALAFQTVRENATK